MLVLRCVDIQKFKAIHFIAGGFGFADVLQ